MSIQSILAVVTGNEDERGALDAVLSMAQAFQASVRLLHMSPPPLLPEMAGVAYYPTPVTLDLLDRDAIAIKARAEGVARDACRHHAVPLREADGDVVIGCAQAFWRHAVGEARDCIPAEVLTVDLVATNYAAGLNADLSVILASLFEGDRAVLAIPGNRASVRMARGFAHTVVFAWDGSRASASALHEAVPHMLHAVDVVVLHITSHQQAMPAVIPADLQAYLRSHGISAEYITLERDDRSVGECLLDETRRLKAGLLVMGAYGHGHIGEMLLGGTTDYVIKHTDLPLLLAR